MKRVLFALLLASCTPDPVHEKAVSALGDEAPGGPSAFHRPGQPCGTCHEAEGPAKSDFSVAGTIFDSPTTRIGVEGARVELRDADGSMPPGNAAVTNCAGNFFVRRSDWSPRFPITVKVTKGEVSRTMESPIGVTASCAACHSLKPSAPPGPISKLAPVYLFDGPDPEGRPEACP
jgi:cytochrome c553